MARDEIDDFLDAPGADEIDAFLDAPAGGEGAQPIAAGVASATPTTDLPPAPAPSGRFETFGRGVIQGATLGFGDELSGALAALAGGDSSVGLTLDQPTFGERYAAGRDFFRAKNRGAQEAFPGTYFGGQVAGGVALPGAGAVSNARNLAGAARIATLASQGAITGGLAGLGGAEGSAGDQIGAGVRGALVGALVTPGIDAGVRAAAIPLAAAARGLTRRSGIALAKVAGGIQRDVGPAGGIEAFADAGLRGRDAGLIRPLDAFPGALDRQAERVADYASKAQQGISQAIDDPAAVAPVKDVLLELGRAASQLRKFPSANAAPLKFLEGISDDLANQADASGNVSARALQTAKETADNFVNTWDPFGKSNLAQGLKKSIYGVLKDAQEDAVAASPASNLAGYQASKRASQLAIKLEDFADSASRREANQLSALGGLHGTLGLLGGLVAGGGDPLTGIAANLAVRAAASPRTHALVAAAMARGARGLPAYAASPFNPLIARAIAQATAGSLR